MKKVLSIKRLIKSFGYAFMGIISTIKSEPNMKIHVFMMCFALVSGFIFSISVLEWCLVLILICLVLAGETINTALENLADVCSPKYNDKIKIAKDAAAGAVLVFAILSVIVGLIIFLPKFLIMIGV